MTGSPRARRTGDPARRSRATSTPSPTGRFTGTIPSTTGGKSTTRLHGHFWWQRVGNFSQIDGKTEEEWKTFVESRKLFVSEFSAEWDGDEPNNVETCRRYAGQNQAKSGDGLLAWLLAADRDIVDTIVPWTTKIRTTSGNQVGGHASELTNDIGELTPAGRAYLAMPNDGASVVCTDVPPPTPPPPSPPPPSPPFPFPPPRAPLSCDVAGLLNARTEYTNDNGDLVAKWCFQVPARKGCTNYYTWVVNDGTIRHCYNPNEPLTDGGMMCEAGDPITCSPPSMPPPAAPPPPDNALKKGLLIGIGMPAIAFKNLDGQAAWAYNYGNIIKDAGQLDYINRNSIEFIPMYNGAYATMTTTEDVPGWSGGSAAGNVRCYFWQDAVPTNPNNENYNADLCTVNDLVSVLNDMQALTTAPIKRVMLWNEPWVGAETPQDPVVAAGWYKAIFEDVIAQTGLEVVMWTSSESDRSLDFDKAFLEECVALGCNLDLLTEVGIHDYKSLERFWRDKYQLDDPNLPDGTYYTQRDDAFANVAQHPATAVPTTCPRPPTGRLVARAPLRVTETNANWENGSADTTNELVRISGRWPAPARAVWRGQHPIHARQFEFGGVAWPAVLPDGPSQQRGRQARAVYEDAELRRGPAWQALPDNGLSVDRTEGRSPSPPPPSPPPPPPLPPHAPRLPGVGRARRAPPDQPAGGRAHQRCNACPVRQPAAQHRHTARAAVHRPARRVLRLRLGQRGRWLVPLSQRPGLARRRQLRRVVQQILLHRRQRQHRLVQRAFAGQQVRGRGHSSGVQPLGAAVHAAPRVAAVAAHVLNRRHRRHYLVDGVIDPSVRRARRSI